MNYAKKKEADLILKSSLGRSISSRDLMLLNVNAGAADSSQVPAGDTCEDDRQGRGGMRC